MLAPVPLDITVIALAALAACTVLAVAFLRAWNGWLALKHRELDRLGPQMNASVSGMIELSDLKERLRKLEAIAAGVDL